MDKIIQITAGRGPAECCWVVAQVLKILITEVKAKGIEYIILQREKGIENGTVQSVSIQLSGTDVNSFLTTWCGTVQWVGTSTFRKYHKRKNWFIGVYELEQLSLSELNEKDISFQTMRSTGPGGQNVNKVSSAIHLRFDIKASSLPDFYKERLLASKDKRITKDGVLVIKAQQFRTQEKNRDDALKRLVEFIKTVAIVQKTRRATKPTKGSKRRRLDEKSRRSKVKSMRGRVND